MEPATLKGKWYILCAVSVRLIASYIAILLAVSTFIAAKETPEISSAKHRDTSTKPQLVIAYVPLLLTAEVFLTFTTAYFLLKSRQAVPYSAGLLKALTVLAFQTAAPPALCALLIFLLSVSFPDGHRPRVTAPVASNTILPKVYVFSMMWTLNSRQKIRMSSVVASSGIIEI